MFFQHLEAGYHGLNPIFSLLIATYQKGALLQPLFMLLAQLAVYLNKSLPVFGHGLKAADKRFNSG